MHPSARGVSRRSFLHGASLAAGGMVAMSRARPAREEPGPDEGLFVIGPRQGYTPHIGVLVSMLDYNRQTIIGSIADLTVEQLDYLHDARANTIGALALHLAAVERFYQVNTFEGRREFNRDERRLWGAALKLGKDARDQIRGHPATYYLERLARVRDRTLATLKAKDDAWLLAVDPASSNDQRGQLNTYWKWFHVCEHESNHRGQIAWLRSRMPGARPSID